MTRRDPPIVHMRYAYDMAAPRHGSSHDRTSLDPENMASLTLVDKNSFLFKKILGHNPDDAQKFCTLLQEEWKEKFAKDDEFMDLMREFKKTRCIHLVWMSDKFGRSPSEEISELKTYRLLSHIYDQCVDRKGADDMPPKNESPEQDPAASYTQDTKDLKTRSHAEDDRKTEVQLRQHLEALIYLFRQLRTDSTTPLSEGLIKHVHYLLMKDLYIDGDTMINAGKYRNCIVCTGMTHTYPDHKVVPSTMERIVTEYNEKFRQPDHHPFHLASWLLYELLSIHPFEDGNGRVSRLMWCFSLMNDDLPFPVIPFPEHTKAYKLYIRCITMDRELSLSSECKHLTTLTLISVTTTWENFIQNLKHEAPQKYKEILDRIQASGINMQKNICE